jgi:alpha-ribazole phosphatase/probable phosphoglycerate mutase
VNSVTIVDIIRHGEPVGGRKYRGQLDDPLSETGWMQMRTAVGRQRPWQQIVTSTLSRCAAFAEELSQSAALPLDYEARFKEIGFGEWEGRTAEELKRVDADAFERFYRDPIAHRPAGAEPLHEFRDRVIEGWELLLNAHAGKHVLVVGHAGVIRMIIRHVLEMPLERMFRIHVANASITRIRVDQNENERTPTLIFHDGRLTAS